MIRAGDARDHHEQAAAQDAAGGGDQGGHEAHLAHETGLQDAERPSGERERQRGDAERRAEKAVDRQSADEPEHDATVGSVLVGNGQCGHEEQ